MPYLRAVCFWTAFFTSLTTPLNSPCGVSPNKGFTSHPLDYVNANIVFVV